ncbi:hypothetical protein FRC19_007583 [Serendipita sp. 401]|nr:hypothetical protein FRC19_007583 [Serendipita sp. 401]KAG9058318.1 hypothetical protein FS842_010688 [Serendipita sp. 407]
MVEVQPLLAPDYNTLILPILRLLGMPKTAYPLLPLNGIFAINKPSGPTSMALITRLKPMFSASRLFASENQLERLKTSSGTGKKAYPGPTQSGELTGKDRNKGKKRGERTNWKKLSRQYVKMGSGGTLDPLANGVLIIGIGDGTKHLGQFLDCYKTYRTRGLLGCETDSYDSEGSLIRIAAWKHVNRALLLSKLDRFRGDIMQTPPIYSALKVDGRPLYEYARQNIPLPRPIEARKVTISSIDLTAFTPSTHHQFRFPSKRLDDDRKRELEKISALIAEKAQESQSATNEIQGDVNSDIINVLPVSGTNERSSPHGSVGEVPGEEVPPIFELEMTVSSGTYVRSIVHDLGIAVGSAAHVVVLTRTRQGEFVLHEETAETADHEGGTVERRGLPCVEWSVLEGALEKWEADEDIDVDADGWTEWELEILNKWPDQTEMMHLP